MLSRNVSTVLVALGCLLIAVPAAISQSFRVQCPTSTITHPGAPDPEPAYNLPTTWTCSVANGCGGSAGNVGYWKPASNVNGSIKCQQISGGDGYSTMANGTQTFMFSFGPLSGLEDIAKGLPGTEFPDIFNVPYPGTLLPGDPATTDDSNTVTPYLFESNTNPTGGPPAFPWNGAVGVTGDPDAAAVPDGGVHAAGTAVLAGGVIDAVTITNPGSGYYGPTTVSFSNPTCAPGTAPAVCAQNAASGVVTVDTNGHVTGVTIAYEGVGYNTVPTVTFSTPTIGCGNSALGANNPACMDGHVDPRQIMDVGVMNGNIPAPLMAIDEDDEFFLTLSNVGMIMRPDLFEQHTVHFHGYPNASSFYDGVPDASVAINIGGSFTYYYLAPDAGTYFYHCHITPPEHLQMGMVGQIYVRPRQNRVPVGNGLLAALKSQQADLRTACRRPGDGVSPAVTEAPDILCTNPLPASSNTATAVATVSTDITGKITAGYAYNDGDGSTYYDVEYPIQIHGFDPNFHFVGMTFNPEMFVDMKDKFFLLNGRSYPDTVKPGPLTTESSDGRNHFSQPLPSIINIPAGGKALLRISDLDVQEFQTLASLGIPMHVIGYNAKLLRDQEGDNTDYYTNSITLGGGESLDVILDASAKDGSGNLLYPKGSTFYLYTPQLDHLANDQENFGGLMTEVHIN